MFRDIEKSASYGEISIVTVGNPTANGPKTVFDVFKIKNTVEKAIGQRKTTPLRYGDRRRREKNDKYERKKIRFRRKSRGKGVGQSTYFKTRKNERPIVVEG